MADTDLVKALDNIFVIFHKYAVREEPCDKLSRAEFSQLAKEQLPNLLQESRTREATDRLFKETDQNKDVELTFEVFMAVLGKVYTDTHPEFHHNP